MADAPLVSTSLMKKTAVSVRRNMAKKLPDDDSNTSESLSVPVLVQDMALDQVPNGNLMNSKTEQEDEESDDEFSDALDTLSPKDRVVEAIKLPMPTADPQSRDFMLNRFLPAARSIAVDQQPQYGLKRQPLPFMSEPLRQIRDIVPAENHATPKRYEYITTPSYYQDMGDDEEESEDDEDDDEYLSRRGCGMSPQVCFKNSLGMLSSVHGLKPKPYSLRTSSHDDHVKSSKVAQLKSRFQSVKKLALDSIYKQKMGSRAQSPVHPTFESNLSTASRPSSPYRQIGCMSPYRSVGNSSPLHTAGFPGTRKEAEIMRANRLNKHIRNISKSQEKLYPKSTKRDCSTSSIMEKTLYVDTENSPKINNDQGNSNINIFPGTVETVSGEPEMAENKPKAILQLKAVESSGTKMMKADVLQKNCDLSPLAPPPPKKPSDSWLLRNLPSVSSKITSRRYLLHPHEKDLEENSTSGTKWETIVKTSCMHRDHIRYSEELVARSSCQSTS